MLILLDVIFVVVRFELTMFASVEFVDCKYVVVWLIDNILDDVTFVKRALLIVPVVIFNSDNAKFPNVAELAFKFEIFVLFNVELVDIKLDVSKLDALMFVDIIFGRLDVVASKLPVVNELVFILPTVNEDIIELDKVDVFAERLFIEPDVLENKELEIDVALIFSELIKDEPNVILSIDEAISIPVVTLLNFALLDETFVLNIFDELMLVDELFVMIAELVDKFVICILDVKILLDVKLVIFEFELDKFVICA